MSTLCKGLNISNRYLLKEFIGQGSFGEVWLACDEITNEDVAIKLYVSLDPEGVEEFKAEYYNTAGLQHRNLLVPTQLQMWENRPFLVMKYCPNGSSSNLAGMVSLDDIWTFVRDVADGLHYLHTLPDPVIHQDIKPDNILIDDNGRFLITDFGISRKVRRTMDHIIPKAHIGGAVAYMGPERFGEEPELVKASDIWALGASIYELVTGRLPFNGMGGGLQRNGADMPHLGKPWPETLDRLMTACLAIDTWQRPSAREVRDYVDAVRSGDDNPAMPWLEHAQPKADTTVLTGTLETETETGSTKADATVFPFNTDNAGTDTMRFSKESVAMPKRRPWYSRILMPAMIIVALALLSMVVIKLLSLHSQDTSKIADTGMTDTTMVKQGLSQTDEPEPEPVEQGLKDTDGNDAAAQTQETQETQGAPAPAVAQPAPSGAEQTTPRKAPSTGNDSYDTSGYPRGYVDPADGGYVPRPKTNIPETRAAKRLDGSIPGREYDPKAASRHMARQTFNTKSQARGGAAANVSTDPATSLDMALATGDYNTVKKLADGGYSGAYGPMAVHCLQTKQYQSAESYALKAKASGSAQGDAVIEQLRKMGYYD